jgi:hypothetical protein
MAPPASRIAMIGASNLPEAAAMIIAAHAHTASQNMRAIVRDVIWRIGLPYEIRP